MAAPSQGHDLLSLLMGGSKAPLASPEAAKVESSAAVLPAELKASHDSASASAQEPSTLHNGAGDGPVVFPTESNSDDLLNSLFRMARNTPYGNISPSALQTAQRERKVSAGSSLLATLQGSRFPADQTVTRSGNSTPSASAAGTPLKSPPSRLPSVSVLPKPQSSFLSDNSRHLLSMLNVAAPSPEVEEAAVDQQTTQTTFVSNSGDDSQTVANENSKSIESGVTNAQIPASNGQPPQTVAESGIVQNDSPHQPSLEQSHSSGTPVKPKPSTSSLSKATTSPFTFVSPFDMLAARTSATTSPANQSRQEQSTSAATLPSSAGDANTHSNQAQGAANGTIIAEEVKNTDQSAQARDGVTIDAMIPDENAQPVQTEHTLSRGVSPNLIAEGAQSDVTISVKAEPQLASSMRNGLAMTPDEERSRDFMVYFSNDNDDLRTDYEPTRQAVSRFNSPLVYSGRRRQIAANGLIAYATRAGRIRIIDPSTGARLIHKAHSGIAQDLAISAEFSEDGQRWRNIASARNQNIHFLRAPASFDSDDPPVKHHEVSIEDWTAGSIQYNPARPDEVRAVSANVEKVAPLSQSGTSSMKTMASSALPSTASPWLGISYTDDGSAVILVSTGGLIEIHDADPSSSKSSQKRYLQRQLQSSATQIITDFIPLSHPVDGRLAAVAIIRGQGNVIDIYSMSTLLQGDSTMPDAVFSLVLDPGMDYDGSFGQVTYISETGTLAISSSYRQSIFLCSLAFPARDALADFSSDAQALSTASSVDTHYASAKTETVTIKRVTEITTDHAIVQLTYAKLDGRHCLFYLHTDGFEQMILDNAVFADSQAAETGSQKQAATDGAVLVGGTQSSDAAASTLPTPASADIDLAIPIEHAIETSPTEEELQPTIDTAKNTPKAADVQKPEFPNFTKALQSGADPAVLLAQMQQLFLEQASLFESMLATQQKAEKARSHQILALVSETLTATTRKMIQDALQRQVTDTIRNEMEQRFLPEVLRSFSDLTRAVDSAAQTQSLAVKQMAMTQVRNSIVEVLANQLPAHFNNMTHQIPLLLAPAIDVTMQRAVSAQVERSEQFIRQAMADQANILNNIRQTTLEQQMRSEENAARYETQIDSLQRDVADLIAGQRQTNDQLAHLLAIAGGGTLGPDANIVSASNGSNLIAEPQRPATPIDQYEDLFLRTLREDKVAPLSVLIDDAPDERLLRIFPSSGPPIISSPNIMAILLQLSILLPKENSPTLSQRERKRLAWLVACNKACYVSMNDVRYRQFLPRVFTGTLHALHTRKGDLQNPHDVELMAAIQDEVEVQYLKLGEH